MAVERTVNIDFQTNAPKAAAEVAQVDKSLQGVAASGNQAATAMDRATSTQVEGGFGRIGRSIKEATRPARDFVGAFTGIVGLASRVGGLIAFAGVAIEGVRQLFGGETPEEKDKREAERQQAIRARVGGQLAGRGQQGAALSRRLEALNAARWRLPGEGFGGEFLLVSQPGQPDQQMSIEQRDEEVKFIMNQLQAIEKKQAADIEAMRKATEATARNTGAANRYRAR